MIEHDTDLGGQAVFFPPTRCSSIRNSGSTDPTARRMAYETLIAAYWKPVYKYIRQRWKLGNDEAKDLTQAFFAKALEHDFFASFDPSRARFRTFVQTCVDGVVNNGLRDASRLKRGGQAQVVTLDFASADAEWSLQAPAADCDPAEFLRQEWVRGLFAAAVADLKRFCDESGKSAHFRLFEQYDLRAAEAGARPTYADLAAEHGLPVTQVTNFLSFARSQFRKRLLQQLEAATASDDEFQEEVARLFGRPK
jgi:RNA polymerase sigma factor (sigma-70 family)